MNSRILRQKRIFISRILAVLLIFVFLFTRTDIGSDVVKVLLDSTGLLLLSVGVLGRIWSSLYICGYKKVKLVTDGPYAAVRNPLYLFSLLGVTGVALSTQNYIFIALILSLFFIYYPIVIISEEKKLKRLHSDNFLKYMAETPRFIPRLSKLSQPEKYEVNVKKYSKAFLDAIWFFVVYIVIAIVKIIHSKGLIPLILDF